MKSLLLCLLFLAALLPPAPGSAQRTNSVDVAAVDAIFEAFDGTRTPGCAVGVSADGVPVLLRAYGTGGRWRGSRGGLGPDGPTTICMSWISPAGRSL